jgi:hypothetical protein
LFGGFKSFQAKNQLRLKYFFKPEQPPYWGLQDSIKGIAFSRLVALKL